MSIIDHVVNLELSIELDELGIQMSSEFWWVDTRKSWKIFNSNMEGDFIAFYGRNGEISDCSEIELVYGYDDAIRAREGYNDSNPIPAYLSSELDDMMKSKAYIEKYFNAFKKWSVRIALSPKWFEDKTEVNAKAKLLIYLLKNNLISLGEVNGK